MPIAMELERVFLGSWSAAGGGEPPAPYFGAASTAQVMISSTGSSAKNGKSKRTIVKVPGVCGGRAVIAGSRMPVWGLEAARRAGVSDQRILQMYPSVTKTQLLAAWKWVKSHRAEIEHDIAENEKA
jgi:uncharacterized protein (DUF433 family)